MNSSMQTFVYILTRKGENRMARLKIVLEGDVELVCDAFYVMKDGNTIMTNCKELTNRKIPTTQIVYVIPLDDEEEKNE